MQIVINRACLTEAPEVAAVLREAADWLVACGQSMWRADEVTVEQVGDAVAAGQFGLARLAGEVVGTVRLTHHDPLFWPELAEGVSVFVHRLAVRHRVAGQGVAQALLRFAADYAVGQGCADLRLDCSADRTALRALYEGFGFRLHSHRQAGPWYVARYCLALPERRVT
ncbi:GNAT family N-acetyltransferase [Neisseriaceae bacterium JH1-16]|nr:GNAT family N-acetyltransferase [Neisseriaceae bacterium JH1-16]